MRTMDGYTVSARIDRASTRVARHGADRVATADTTPRSDADDPLDLLGRPFDEVLLGRWEAFRERWSQTTFFLFDADSWRR